jgi:hypothetical protein
MALQSQTYANSGDGYYIEREEPITPGNTAIRGPVEILPANTSVRPVYYNVLQQSDAAGLSIGEYETAGPILSEIIMRPSKDILLTSYKTNARATLQVGTQDPDSLGEVNLYANDGLYVRDFANSGDPLHLFHDTATNKNIIKTKGSAGARLEFNANTRDIAFRNALTSDSILITDQTNRIVVRTTDAQTIRTTLSADGLEFVNAGTIGNVGIFGGTDVILGSSSSVGIRTGLNSGSPLQNITANLDGTTTFLSTITAPFANITDTLTSVNANITNTLTALNATISTLTNTVSLTSPLATISTLTNTVSMTSPLATISTLTNTVSLSSPLATITSILGLTSINTIPIADFGVPIGTIISFAAWNPPPGYLRCDGSQVSATIYSSLYAVIGNTYDDVIVPGDFRLPDLGGKVLTGALAQYNKTGGAPPNTLAYGADATFQGVVTGVVNPLGGATSGIWISSSTKPIVQGMVLSSTIGLSSSSFIVQYVVGGDGRLIGANRGFLVIFQGDVTNTGMVQGTVVVFNPNSTNTTIGQNYPQLGASGTDGNFALGNMAMFQDTSQVGAHNHGSVANASQNVCSSASGRSEPLFGVPGNAGIFNLTVPAWGGFPALNINAPRTMYSLPYNAGVTMCIKY